MLATICMLFFSKQTCEQKQMEIKSKDKKKTEDAQIQLVHKDVQ